MITSVGLSAGAAFVSDSIAQLLEHSGDSSVNFNPTRAGAMGVWGCLGAPVAVVWFRYLDRKYPPSKNLLTVLKKVAINQGTMGALVAVAFLGFVSLRDEGSFLQSWRERTQKSFIPLFTHGMTYWSLAHTLNFYFIPPHLRVIYQSFAGLLWTVYLSWEGHKPISEQSVKVRKDMLV